MGKSLIESRHRPGLHAETLRPRDGFVRRRPAGGGVMSAVDWAGSIGVALLLAAFFGNAIGRPADGGEPPRAVGAHETRLRGVPVQRYSSSYTLWMVQRPLDAYRALPRDARAAVDRVLAGTGCEALVALTPRHRLGKRRFRLALEKA